MKGWQQLCGLFTSRVSSTALRCAAQLAAGAVLATGRSHARVYLCLPRAVLSWKAGAIEIQLYPAGQILVALPVLILYPNFLSKVAWIATINYAAPMYLIAAV